MSADVLIIESRFYDDIGDKLLEGASAVLEDAGAAYDVITVPGALEVPAALNFAVKNELRRHDAYVALGCVIRGETTHYDIVCNESASGIYRLVLDHDLAFGNGILTVENREQAARRADPQQKNAGGGAARAALRMLEIKRETV